MKASILMGLLLLGATQAARPVQPALPPDMLEPEGRTRWDLTGVPTRPGSASPETDRAALRPGERRLRLVDGTEAEVITVGIGWVHLPSGPREVALQRVRIHGRGGDVLVHRWVDPEVGIVAEIRGPAGPNGRRLAVTDGYVVTSVQSPTALSKIYVHETEGTP